MTEEWKINYMGKKVRIKDTDVSNVEKMRNNIIPEEFPEGAFGSAFGDNVPVSGKSTPWKEDQRSMSAYVYPDKDFHDDLPRQAPNAHPLHDETDEESDFD